MLFFRPTAVRRLMALSTVLLLQLTAVDGLVETDTLPDRLDLDDLTTEELRQTFGVKLAYKATPHKLLIPEASYDTNGSLQSMSIFLDGERRQFKVEPSHQSLTSEAMAVVSRGRRRHTLQVRPSTSKCHYQHISDSFSMAVSNCDGNFRGVILTHNSTFVLHPAPERHQIRAKRSTGDRSARDLHVLYKRDTSDFSESGTIETQTANDFCGLETKFSDEDLLTEDLAVHDSEDLGVVAQRLTQKSNLVAEIAIFVDYKLWNKFKSKYSGKAESELEDYVVTVMNNIQIHYKQATMLPPLHFKIVRYEIFKYQPSALASSMHSNGHAQTYLDRFCRYQDALSNRNWDHAFLLTGYDLHRGGHSRSISGIARLHGMCDSHNTCTVAEGLDFTSVFIGTHELGHSVGMRHDEPYCSSKYIMSASLGPGKVTWSSCSMRDYHKFVDRLDQRNRNCMRASNEPDRLHLDQSKLPGQIYGADDQCALMHGSLYKRVKPRSDHYDGICHIMWCGQSNFGRIITSHPALEGTFCDEGKWCVKGRCVPWSNRPNAPALPKTSITPRRPSVLDGNWSAWSSVNCDNCQCAPFTKGVGVQTSQRTCTNPAPSNGGRECEGPTVRGIICSRSCGAGRQSIERYMQDICTNHRSVKKDYELTGHGSQLTRYPVRACKVFCNVENSFGGSRNYRFFGDNLPDGTPCGIPGGDRYCAGGECLPLACGGTSLALRDAGCPSTSQTCPLVTVTVNNRPASQSYKWTAWSAWSHCSSTCGHGTKRRNRQCSRSGQCSGDDEDTTNCYRQACPRATSTPSVSWTQWSDWNQCSTSCGRGVQAKYRRCEAGGRTKTGCSGDSGKTRECYLGTCGAWTEWSVWSACSRSCGPEGARTRSRSCSHGKDCSGDGRQKESCQTHVKCEADFKTGEWTSWSVWSRCSATCGGGSKTRERDCVKGSCAGVGLMRLSCNNAACPSSSTKKPGAWSGWGVWTSCSRTCGAGARTRTRTCSGSSCSGNRKDSSACNTNSCPSTETAEKERWSSWSTWSECTRTCGSDGIRRRRRICYGGANCPGASTEDEDCGRENCAEWGGWGYWSNCSTSCGTGTRRRVRNCYGSGNCYGGRDQTQACSEPSCATT